MNDLIEELTQDKALLQIEASLLYLKNQKAIELIEASIKLYRDRSLISKDELVDMFLDIREVLKG